MANRTICDVKTLAASISVDDKKHLKNKARSELALTVGLPMSKKSILENSKNEVGANVKLIDKRIKLEKERHKAHEEFFD